MQNIRLLFPEDGARIPAIALTAYSGVEQRTRVLVAGFQVYVPKPVDPAEVLDVIAALARVAVTKRPRASMKWDSFTGIFKATLVM